MGVLRQFRSGYGYYPDGYSIQFYANGAPSAPGSSLTFGFNSTDSPDIVEGASPYLPIAATTSYVYMGYAEGDPGAEISLTPAPEPSSLALLTTGAIGLMLIGWRHSGRQQLALVKLREFWKGH